MAQQNSSQPNYQKLVVSTISHHFGYFIVGAAVFVFLAIATFVVIRSKSLNPSITDQSASQTTTAPTETPAPTIGKTYIVQAGDYLWKIAESAYGSGYNAYDIASENKIINPNLIYAGQQLVLPSIAPKEATIGQISPNAAYTNIPSEVKATTYKVQKGDSLWSISQLLYGNPYEWGKIADANNLKNPSIIHVGNILNIPSKTQARL